VGHGRPAANFAIVSKANGPNEGLDVTVTRACPLHAGLQRRVVEALLALVTGPMT
jgi:hypothetical protein